jgi:protein-disulfide isomerase
MQMDRRRFWLLLALAPLAIVTTVSLSLRAHAQDASILQPPKGAKLALVVFEDLQCPDCANANPLLLDAARKYRIPLVRHDFPLPQHAWAFDAAVFARYFDKLSVKMGDAYRDYVFAHQRQITKDNLRQITDQFARGQEVSLPFAVDPSGKLAGLVGADKVFGERVGITHTPTIYVVSNTRQGKPFVEVVDRAQLFQLIDTMKAQTR